MYRLPPIVLIFCLLVACSNNARIASVLNRADTLIEANPDSAALLLCTIEDIIQSADEQHIMLYTLLTIKAKYKLYEPIIIDEERLSDVTNYYKKVGDLQRLADAIYYHAMLLYEKRKHEESLILLKEGESLAHQLNDPLLLSKYYESLCMVNDHSKYYELMLKYAKLFLDNSIQRQDEECIARGYSHVSTAYIRMNEKDSANIFILKATPYISKLSKDIQSSILTNIGCVFKKYKDYVKAKDYLEQAIRIKPRNNTYCALGYIYAETGDTLRAKECWEKALCTNDPDVRIWTLDYLYRFYRSNGENGKALHYHEQLSNLKDSVALVSEQANIAEIQLKYDHQVIENEKQRYYLYFLCTVIVCLMVIILTILLTKYLRNKIQVYENTIKKDLEKIKAYEEEIVKVKAKGEDSLMAIEILKNKINATRKAMNDRLSRGLEVYELAMNNEVMSKQTGDDRCFIEYFSVRHHDCYIKIEEQYSKPSPRLMAYLCLIELGKTEDEIIKILDIKKGSLRSIKKRANDCMKAEKGG